MQGKACIAETDEEAREILDYHRIYFSRGNAYNERFEPWLREITSPEDMTLDHVFPDRVLWGSPQRWIDTLRDWQARFDLEEIIVRLRYFYGPPLEVELRSRQLSHDKVIPAFS